MISTARLIALLLVLPTLVLPTPTPTLAREPTPSGTQTEVEWLKVVLAGRKIGHARIEREVTVAKVTTRQLMQFELGRSGVGMVMSTFESHEETADGQPLAFTSVSSMSGLKMRVEGRRLDGDRFSVQSGAIGALRESEIAWPDGALLAHGLEQRLRSAGTAPGTRVEALLFQPLLQEAVTVVHEVIGPVTLDLPGGPELLTQARQSLAFPGGDMTSQVWMDANLGMRRMTLEVMGQTLELLACEQACALAPNQPAEILSTALMPAPRALDRAERRRPLSLVLRSERELSGWPGIDGQRLEALAGDRYRLSTRVDGPASPIPAPTQRDLLRTDWLDYDTPAVAALLVGLDLEGDAALRMRRLQDVVHRHIDTKNLRIGYASAGDAARLREGDCTEHALLLAALGRAAGVPTRVVNGLAYSEDFEPGRAVFVPHAWVAAWTGERWQAYDAALPGDDQLRLAMHADDGDPWRFYSGLDVLGNLRIESIESAHALP